MHEWLCFCVDKTLFTKANGGPDQDHEPNLASLCFKAMSRLLSRGITHVRVLVLECWQTRKGVAGTEPSTQHALSWGSSASRPTLLLLLSVLLRDHQL